MVIWKDIKDWKNFWVSQSLFFLGKHIIILIHPFFEIILDKYFAGVQPQHCSGLTHNRFLGSLLEMLRYHAVLELLTHTILTTSQPLKTVFLWQNYHQCPFVLYKVWLLYFPQNNLILNFLTLTEARPQKISCDSELFLSTKSLVKGERFMQFEEKPEYNPHFLSNNYFI